jgi:hypothetical protein
MDKADQVRPGRRRVRADEGRSRRARRRMKEEDEGGKRSGSF